MNKLALSIRDALLGVDKDELVRKATEKSKPTRATGGVVYTDVNSDHIPLNLDNGYVISKRELEKYELSEPQEINYVKVGDLDIFPGRYARPKGFAKAFLVVMPDGALFYENKNRVLKKITENAFLTHWNKGMNTLVLDD